MALDKKKTIRRIRNLSIAAGTLLLLTVAAGVGYIWYIGQLAPVSVTPLAAAEASRDYKPIQPVKPAENVRQGVSVQSITSPVVPGSNASMAIKTNPNSTCTIKVEYNKVASTDSGLIAKESDEYGSITWAWTVEDTVPLGKWPITATCKRTNNPDNWSVVASELVVKATLD